MTETSTTVKYDHSSLRVGQFTFLSSWRTSLRNCRGGVRFLRCCSPGCGRRCGADRPARFVAVRRSFIRRAPYLLARGGGQREGEVVASGFAGGVHHRPVRARRKRERSKATDTPRPQAGSVRG